MGVYLSNKNTARILAGKNCVGTLNNGEGNFEALPRALWL